MIYLVYSALLGILTLLIGATLATAQTGPKYNLSPRDEPKPLKGVAGRVDRAFKNYMETFPILATLALTAFALGKASSMIENGLCLYFWARLIYLPLYAFGVPVARTAAWGASLVGIAMVAIACLS